MLHYNYIRPDGGRYCILARHAKDEINAARHAAIAERLDNLGGKDLQKRKVLNQNE